MAIRIAWLIAILGMAIATPAKADSPKRPFTYKQVTPNGKYVFVMIAPDILIPEVQREDKTTNDGEQDIRRKYARSGMYRNDGSTEPLWTVDWYALAIDLAPDGDHLVRQGPWAWLKKDRTPDLNVEAVSFFSNGHLIRTYKVEDLIDNPKKFQLTVSHYRWQMESRLTGDHEYKISTYDGNHFTFDIRTGEIVSAFRVGKVHGGLVCYCC